MSKIVYFGLLSMAVIFSIIIAPSEASEAKKTQNDQFADVTDVIDGQK